MAAPPTPDGTSARVHDARAADVGGFTVRRALPRVGLRTVGAWCFADHMGPEVVTETSGLDVGPHPHIGLQTVTWLVEGSIRHTDSLGSDQLIRPGQLNLMTAGHGIVHAEESVRARGTLHGVQLWIAQPEQTRHGPSSFSHLAELPVVDVEHGNATVMIGDYARAESAAAVDTPLMGVDFDLQAGASTHALRSDFEYAVYVVHGRARVDGTVVAEGQLLDLRRHPAELLVETLEPTRLLLLGGLPLGEPLTMWWNFVGRSREEIATAATDWAAYVDSGASASDVVDRFATVTSRIAPIPAPTLV